MLSVNYVPELSQTHERARGIWNAMCAFRLYETRIGLTNLHTAEDAAEKTSRGSPRSLRRDGVPWHDAGTTRRRRSWSSYEHESRGSSTDDGGWVEMCASAWKCAPLGNYLGVIDRGGCTAIFSLRCENLSINDRTAGRKNMHVFRTFTATGATQKEMIFFVERHVTIASQSC